MVTVAVLKPSALGLNTVALEEAHQISKELIKTVRELHHAEQLEKISHVENTVAIEAETVAQEEAAVATGLSTGGIGLFIAALAAAIAFPNAFLGSPSFNRGSAKVI